MILDAEQVSTLQNNQPPTDWSKFGQSISATDFAKGAFQGDDRLHVRFFTQARIDVVASTKENRPIFTDVHYVEIMMPGDKNNIVVEPVWDQHKQRFPRQWENFLKGVEQTVSGTPLKVAPFLTPSNIASLNLLNIMTLEQLANLPDSSMSFMGASEFKNAAKRYLELTSSNEALLERIRQLEAKVSEQPQPEASARTQPDASRLTVAERQQLGRRT